MPRIANATVPEIEVTPEMIEAGIKVFSGRKVLTDVDVVKEVFLAMCITGPDPRFREFGLETIYNITEAIECLKDCERRVKEHLSEIIGLSE